MSSSTRQYDLVLLGASGYTGKFTAEWISKSLPTNIKWAIAGRNPKKLQAIADELAQQNPDRPNPIIEHVELEKSQLDELAKKTRLIITTVGPYLKYGEPVLAACAENGTHYIDCTGEIPWYYEMVEKYHDIAQKNGAIIIPECGLDSVPADILSYLVAKHIRRTLNAATQTVTMSLYAFKTGISGGTSSTALNIVSHYSAAHLAKSMSPYSISPVGRPAQTAKGPSSSLLYSLLGLPFIKELGGIQTTGMMASIDRCLVHRSWGLHAAIAKSTSQEALSYGPRFSFTEYMRTKSLIKGAIWKFGFALTGLLLVFPPTRWILAPILENFVIQKPGEGPSKESMKNDFMNYKALGVADTDKKEKVLGSFSFAIGAYDFTGLSMTAAADVILRGDLASTEAGKLGGGILTPAMLGDQFVDQMKERGVKIEIGT